MQTTDDHIRPRLRLRTPRVVEFRLRVHRSLQVWSLDLDRVSNN